MTDAELIGRVIEEAPGSIRELAREAGVSHVLLITIRDGKARLTPKTRKALATALRRWSERLEGLVELLNEGEDKDGDD